MIGIVSVGRNLKPKTYERSIIKLNGCNWAINKKLFHIKNSYLNEILRNTNYFFAFM